MRLIKARKKERGHLHIELGVAAGLHVLAQRGGKGALPHRLDRVVLELVQDDLPVHHHKALHPQHLG